MYCPNCGKKIDTNAKFCTSCGRPIETGQQTITTPKTTNLVAQKTTPAPEPAKSHGCLISFIVVLIIAVSAGLLFYFLVVKDVNKNNNNGSNSIKDQVISAPTITTDQDLTNIIVNIYCNDNYKFVEVSLEICNDSGTIIKSTTLQGTGYYKGNTYQLKYRLSTSELLNASHYRCKLSNYY